MCSSHPPTYVCVVHCWHIPRRRLLFCGRKYYITRLVAMVWLIKRWRKDDRQYDKFFLFLSAAADDTNRICFIISRAVWMLNEILRWWWRMRDDREREKYVQWIFLKKKQHFVRGNLEHTFRYERFAVVAANQKVNTNTRVTVDCLLRLKLHARIKCVYVRERIVWMRWCYAMRGMTLTRRQRHINAWHWRTWHYHIPVPLDRRYSLAFVMYAATAIAARDGFPSS